MMTVCLMTVTDCDCDWPSLAGLQAVQCSLTPVSPVGGSCWSAKAVSRFVQLVDRPCLLATVLGRRPDGQLDLDLLEVAPLLVKEGLAARSRNKPQQLVGRMLPG